MTASIDIPIKSKWGHLIVLREEPRSTHGHRMFRVLCERDGNQKVVAASNLKNGDTRSCGCLQAETRSETGKRVGPKNIKKATLASIAHGHTRGRKTPEYQTWEAMRSRCNNPNAINYKDYGGRGITIDPRWDAYEAFFADMGLRPSLDHQIDRIDVNGNYEPGNCRWTLPVVNGNNRRNNHRVTMAGETHTVAEWCRDLSVTKRILLNRVGRWSPQIFAEWVRICREQTGASSVGA